MRPKTISILIFVSILTSEFAFAQQPVVQTDTNKLYRNIETYSKRSKFTKFIYHSIFRPVDPALKKKKVYKKLIQKPYASFEGKIIRHINIVTLDPFGYSITDTNLAPRYFVLKAGNTLHVKSHSSTIRNLLLIRENQEFDSLLEKESERLVRSQKYVHEVSFFIVATSKNSDSVDIFIRELDNWSIVPIVKATNTRLRITLTDNNFLGLGHESRNEYTWYHTTGHDAYRITYFVPTIRNTHISAALHYNTDQFRNYNYGLYVDRPFFSPIARWAGGAYVMQYRKDSIYIIDSVFQRYKFNVQDYWAGHAMQLYKGNSEHFRTTNFIATARFLQRHYLDKPIEMYDTLHQFYSEDFYMGSVGISTRKYVQDRYIFRFGVTEDVPIGKVYNLTGGYQKKDNSGRFYLGVRLSFGNYYPWGYITSNFEYGTFFNGSHAEEGILTAGVNYFTGLVEIGKWKFRQFVKTQINIGINRLPNESITLNDGAGIDGFNSSTLSGTSRVLMRLQTQSYAPWNLIGFCFGGYLDC